VAELSEFDEILDNCLEALEGGEGLAHVLARYPQVSDELKPLLEAAEWFEGQKATVDPRPGFVQASSKRLVEKIAAEPVIAGGWLERTWAQLLPGLGSGWRVALQLALVAVILACLVVGGSGVALASQSTLPGERLYPVKIALEGVELLVTTDPAEKIQLHSQFAQARLAEIQELATLGRYNYIRETVSNFEAHVTQASQLLSVLARKDPQKAKELAVALKASFASQRTFLGFLIAAVPQEVTPELRRAIGIAASSEIAVQAALDQASAAADLTATPTPLAGAGVEGTATAPDQRSALAPTPTPLPAGATPMAAADTATPDNTAAPPFTGTPLPTRTPTPVPKRENPTPTYTSRPTTHPPEATREPRPTKVPKRTKEPKKTSRPPHPPRPTRRPPKP
jgi:hypothetical protein